MQLSTAPASIDHKAKIWRLYRNAMKGHIEAIWGWNPAWQQADFDKAYTGSATSVIKFGDCFAGYLQLDRGEARTTCAC